MRVSGVWVVVLVGCAGPELPPEPPCRPGQRTDPTHTCYPPGEMRGPLGFDATLGGLESAETELIAAYRLAATRGERRHQGVGPWNLRDALDPCQVRHMLGGREAGGPDPSYRPRQAMLPEAERQGLRQALASAYEQLRAHYADRLRLDLEVEDLHAFWLRSLDLIAVTEHYVREVERDAYADEPQGESERRDRFYNRYALPLSNAHHQVSAAIEAKGATGQLGSTTFAWGVRGLEIAFTAPVLPGEPHPDITVRLAAVRRRLQLEAADPQRSTRRAGDEALDAALQATLDAERARDGADRIDALREQLEAKQQVD